MSAATARDLDTLAKAAGELLVGVSGPGSVRVSGLSYDSREVRPGDLFFCIPGARRDGHDFARVAAGSGAAALCVERPTGVGLHEIVVTDSRRAMPRIAAEWFGRPGDALTVIGVTGTNGKTTTAFLIESILQADGRRTGLIGTVETRVGGERRKGARTTPESLDLQRLLAEMRDAGVDSVVMEVTSHALALHRVEGLRFASAAFTNLSQDHLDFHSSMDDYFAAKRALFTPGKTLRGTVNIDDPYGRRLKEEAPIEIAGFGHSSDADLRALDVTFAPSGTEIVMLAGSRVYPHTTELKVSTSLIGAFNVSNCLAAAAAGLQAGAGPASVEAGLRSVTAVPGRFETIDEGQPFSVAVDYAHTPDSLDNVLREARRVAERGGGRVLCVFGCGGDRDKGKRPLMGTAAARLADVVVVTSDNPRSEPPMAIIGQIVEGVIAERAAGPDIVTPDRAEAIRTTLSLAHAGDIVVIAGKGHETGQEFADRVVDFDDRDVARAALRDLGWGL